jgi:hypothetical protein
MRADKQKVTDEVWDDDRVKSFLEPRLAVGKDSADFTLLLHAYQGMRPGDFDRFIAFFTADGHDLNATNEQGETFVDYVARHRKATPFVEVMVAAGARAAAG